MQFTGAIAPTDQLAMPGKNQLDAQPNHLHAAVGAPVEDSKRSVLEVLNQRGRHVVTCMLFECMAVHPLFTVQTGRNMKPRPSPARSQRLPGAGSEWVRRNLEAKSVGLMAYSAAVAVYVVSDLHLDENNDARLFRDDRQGRALASLCDQIAQTVRSWSCSATSLT